MGEIKGVNAGEGYVSVEEAKQGVIDFVRQYVGPRTDSRLAPDLVFAASVIQQTIPKSVLTGEKLKRYEKALDILWRLRDDMGHLEATIGIFWPDADSEE